MKDFLNFIREQGVVGLAIGFILGGAISTVVASLVNDIINPLLGVALGSAEGLKAASFSIFGAELLIGKFITVLINFIIIAAVVFYGFKGLKLDQLDVKKAK